MKLGCSPTKTTHAYGEPSYWDNRYRQDPNPFDWYQKYRTLAPLFDLYLLRSHRVLLVGCGNSSADAEDLYYEDDELVEAGANFALGEEMVADGYLDVVSIDISSVVVEAMQRKYHDKPEMKYIKMDVRDMNGFGSGSFDVVIDKGTLDSLMCGHDAQHNAKKMLQEVGRILKGKGIYILITYGDPTYRLHLLRELKLWTVKLHVIDRMERACKQKAWELTVPLPLNVDGSSVKAVLGSNSEVHYIYVCTKDESLRNQQA